MPKVPKHIVGYAKMIVSARKRFSDGRRFSVNASKPKQEIVNSLKIVLRDLDNTIPHLWGLVPRKFDSIRNDLKYFNKVEITALLQNPGKRKLFVDFSKLSQARMLRKAIETKTLSTKLVNELVPKK